MSDYLKLRGFIFAEVRDINGKIKWRSESENTVVTTGLAYVMNNDTAAASLFIGLKDTGSVVAGDTLASHGGWAEITAIYSGNRPGWTENGGGGASLSNSSSKASFAITGTDDVYGAFLCTVASGTAGTLIGAGDFVEGARSVVNTDTLNVQYELAAT